MTGSPALSFEQSLKLFDPLLRVRPAKFLTEKWIIERKGYIAPVELWYLKRRSDRALRFSKNTHDVKKRETLLKLHREVGEEYESARDGHRVVLIAGSLDRRVFDLLAAGDMQRYGGYSRFADELEKNEKAKEQALERELAGMRDDLHSEAHDKLNFAWRKKDDKLAHWDGKQKLTDIIR